MSKLKQTLILTLGCIDFNKLIFALLAYLTICNYVLFHFLINLQLIFAVGGNVKVITLRFILIIISWFESLLVI
jgi:hypothetical protein